MIRCKVYEYPADRMLPLWWVLRVMVAQLMTASKRG